MKDKDPIFSVERAEDSSGFLLWQVTNLWQREIRKALEAYDITHSQFVLLASIQWLSQQKQEVTQVLLASHTKIDPMTTSTVLRTLESKGLVERQSHATDTRAKTVSLTENGRKTVRQAVKTVEDFDRAFFRPVSHQEGSFNQFLQTLLTVTGSGQ